MEDCTAAEEIEADDPPPGGCNDWAYSLAEYSALNTLRQNELSLIDLTGSVTDYRVVKLLAVLQRLVCSARNLGRSGTKEDDFLTFYGTMYCKIAVVLSDHLGPYFGFIILMHCSYVCFEAAICILDMQRNRLAAALNTLHQNELSLIDLTGSVTDYRVVKLLVFVSCIKGDRLIYALNSLLKNDADLSRLHAIQNSVGLSYV
uniref:Uncharacterized protein n=1 Tax=Anopheles merus TaxID=30066 RepID=A0A182V5A7_ANOME